MKKIVSAILSAAMLFSMAACGSQGNTKGSLYICVIKAGYGDEFVQAAAKEFSKRTGAPVSIKSIVDKTYTLTTLEAGAANNDIDLYFAVGNQFFDTIGKSSGVDSLFADLSDVYDSTAEGYDTQYTIREMVGEELMESVTYGTTPFAVPWATGVEGFVYNTDLFERYSLSVPKTTDDFYSFVKT